MSQTERAEGGGPRTDTGRATDTGGAGAVATDGAAASGPDTAPAPEPPVVADGRAAGRMWTFALFRSEVLITFRRWRILVLLAVLAALPVLVGVAVKIETGGSGPSGGGGPAFISQITNNGLFLVFTSLAVTLPFFLPMTVGVVAGDSVAGEANAGTLRYLLVAPAGRTRLLLAKYATTLVFCLAATLTVALSALVVGSLLFPVGDVTLLSGTTVTFGEGLLRALAVAVAVAVSLMGLAAVGLFISTLTNSGIAAMAATVGLLITVQILGSIPQLDAVHPYLFPQHWLSFADLLRDPVLWDGLLKNAGLQALYAAVFGSAAWARFTNRDITV